MSTTSQKKRPVDEDLEDTGTFAELFDDVAAKPSLDHETLAYEGEGQVTNPDLTKKREFAHDLLDHVLLGNMQTAVVQVGSREILIEASK